MKKKVNPEVKANVLSGMSSAAGSAGGVVLGSVIGTQKANAAEVEALAEEVGAGTSSADYVTGNHIAAAAESADNEVPAAVVGESVETDDIDVSVISSEPNESDVEVIDHPIEANAEEPRVTHFETVTLDDGQQIEVAAIEAEGQTIGIADLDLDGVADIAFSDLNGNGELEQGEVEDISQAGIAMLQLHDAVNTDEGLTAQTAENDYVNDADVDMYYA